MNILEIYLLGCLIAFIIEVITYLRIWQFTKWDLGFIFIIAVPLSWLWVLFFLMWVYEMMGWDYEWPKTDPYAFPAWRLRREIEKRK